MSGVTEVEDVGVFSGGTVRYSHGLYKDNNDLDHDARGSQSGIGITASDTETNNIVVTYILTSQINAGHAAVTATGNAPRAGVGAKATAATATATANDALVVTETVEAPAEPGAVAATANDATAGLVEFPRTASYQIFIDWDNDGGLQLGEFEATTEGWIGFGSIAPTLTVSDTRAKSGNKSLRIDFRTFNPFQFGVAGSGFDQGGFGGDQFDPPELPIKFDQAGQGFDDGRFAAFKDQTAPDPAEPAFQSPGIERPFTGLFVGRVYELVAWVFVPTGSPAVRVGVRGIGTSAASSTNDAWERLSFSFAATSTDHVLELTTDEDNPASAPVWADLFQVLGPGEDVSHRVLGLRQALAFSAGRDTARSLAAIKPGETRMVLDNESGDYSPDNPGSLLASFLGPGRPVLIRAEHGNRIYNLFRGYLDSYDLSPNPDSRSVELGALDLLGVLADAEMSTQLYSSLRTGAAVNALLDEIGWPSSLRDIDPGATTIQWWWEEGTTGLEALAKIVDSEGPPAIAYVDTSGNLVFRDRHHRMTRAESTAIQATIRDGHEEPMFSPPLNYDIGWRDLINDVVIDVTERRPDVEQRVWSTQDRFVIEPGGTREFIVKPSDPFLNAQVPVGQAFNVDGYEVEPDFVIESGSVGEVTLSRTSGQSTKIIVKSDSGVPTVIQGMALRASPVTVHLEQQVRRADTDSQAQHGVKSLQEEAPWVTVNDAEAISELIIGNRSQRLPVVQIRITNGNAQRMAHILQRRLSDRIHIVEMLQSFMDHDFFIEQISHEIAQVGYDHSVVLGCERAREQVFKATEDETEPPPAFMFDVDGQGFDDGYFEPGDGFQLAETVFKLGSSQLDVDGLGY
ncbi:hypothetical protein [Streptomyces sp. CC53]|uniref:hypothetical protein n=1 Tax=Streptomyces sp. CC53 TaxID=1906740 RepID=UPI00115FE65D|nr:hypothetical protein [Streptomyces sp. CC53]